MNNELIYYDEPKIIFSHLQSTEDARDGLTLFGPYAKSSGSIKIGFIGRPEGIQAYENFINELNKPLITKSAGRPSFPGFKTVFNLDWPSTPIAKIILKSEEILNILSSNKNLYERTYKLVSLYINNIKEYLQKEEYQVDLWYIVIPHEIWLNCRPKSLSGRPTISKTQIEIYSSGQRSLLPEDDEKIKSFIDMYESDSDFHDQLKARMLEEKIQAPIQIMLENTLEFKGKDHKPYDKEMKAHLLWTQSTSSYYKLGYLPWKLASVRKGVCYIGLTFKTLQNYQRRKGYACCAAQMFLDSGDGMVFRGNIGPWRGKNEKTYHLDTPSAKELIHIALESYKDVANEYPLEVFIHGRTQFNDQEWSGFCEAIEVSPNSNLVGITINEIDGFRLFRNTTSEDCKYGIMRGLALKVDDKNGYLWTKGYIPKTETTNHMEIARPIKIKISRGVSDLDTVMKDILCLTKLNYNACIYGDGLPVTLRFSDKIGDILTALKDVTWPVRQFKYYI
jgi:hypothetical protein